ncbi:MAG: MFS transporter [Polyangiaceae bacterium]
MAPNASATPNAPRPALGEVYAPPKSDGENGGAGGDGGAQGAGGEEAGRENARQGAAWTLTTYFAEGLPFSLVHQVSAELFTAVGASLVAVGYTSFYGLAWNVKFLWSPLVDRYGTLRRWIVGAQVLAAIVLAVASLRAGEKDIAPVAIALIAVAFLGATQDVAVDGYYLAALDKPAQASLSGTRVTAYRVALLVGKSGLVALAGLVSWRAAFLAAAAMMGGLALLHRTLLRPLRGAVKPGPSGPVGAAKAFAESFVSFLKKPQIGVTLGFVLTFKAGDALLFNQSPPFLASLGLDLTARSALSVPSLVASVVGTTIGGIWIKRTSLARTLAPIAAMQAFAIPVYSALAVLRPSFWGVAVAVSAEQLIAGLGNAGLLVFLMRRADGEHKTAHFAIGTALMSVPVTLAGLVSGRLAEGLGFTKFFVVAFLFAVPGVLLAQRVPKD